MTVKRTFIERRTKNNNVPFEIFEIFDLVAEVVVLR